MKAEKRHVCRCGHVLTRKTARVVRHTKNGRGYVRCLICHAARQRAYRLRCAA